MDWTFACKAGGWEGWRHQWCLPLRGRKPTTQLTYRLRSLLVRVHVHLYKLHAAAVLRRELAKVGRNFLARTAPVGGKVNKRLWRGIQHRLQRLCALVKLVVGRAVVATARDAAVTMARKKTGTKGTWGYRPKCAQCGKHLAVRRARRGPPPNAAGRLLFWIHFFEATWLCRGAAVRPARLKCLSKAPTALMLRPVVALVPRRAALARAGPPRRSPRTGSRRAR